MTKTLSFLASFLLATSAAAAELRLPATAPALTAQITAACADCNATGYTACGSPAVGWGKRFAANAFLGTPKRAYLVTFTMSGEDFRTLARTSDYATLLRTLRERFAKSRLVVIADGFATARVLQRPEQIAVTFPEPLHTCVHDSTRPWACCVDCKNECCEKSLGSPEVDLTWHDNDETLTFHYSHTIGISWLDRNAGVQRTRYACLSDAKGQLRSSAAQ